MSNVTVNGEPAGETTGSTGIRWEDTPNRHAYCDSEIRRLRAMLATAEPVAVVASRDSVAPELAAAMAETRGMREKLAAEAARLDAEAAKAQEARDGSRDGIYRMMLDLRALLCREHAATFRAIAGLDG